MNIQKKVNHKNDTPLHQAAWHQSKAMVELLISNGAKTDVYNILYPKVIILFLNKRIDN